MTVAIVRSDGSPSVSSTYRGASVFVDNGKARLSFASSCVTVAPVCPDIRNFAFLFQFRKAFGTNVGHGPAVMFGNPTHGIGTNPYCEFVGIWNGEVFDWFTSDGRIAMGVSP